MTHLTNKGCCEKCRDRLGGNPDIGYTPQCSFHGNCKCHTDHIADVSKMVSTDSKVEGWEKEFDRLWAKHFADLKEKRRFPTRARFKDFIRFLLSSYGKEQYERGYEEGQDNTIEADGLARDSLWFEKGKEAARGEAKKLVEGMKKTWPQPIPLTITIADGYNQAIREVVALLSAKEKEV